MSRTHVACIACPVCDNQRLMCSLTRASCLAFATLWLCAAVLYPQSSPSQAADAMELVKQGRKLNSEGKQDEALALYHKALQASPNLFEAHLATGVALDLKGDYENARHHLARAIEIAPPKSKDQALITMAMSYAFEHKAKEAAKFEQQLFDARIAEQRFTDAGETADELARIYLESDDLNEAYKWYQTGYETAHRKTDLSPAEKDLWDFRWEHAQARIAARRGKSDEAEKHVALAKAVLDKGGNPNQAQFYPYLTGYVAFYTGDYQRAIAELLKSNQNDPFILSLIAQAYEKLGDKAQAADYYRKVLASNIHNPNNAFARPLAKKKRG